MRKFDDTLHEIKTKLEEHKANTPKIHLAPIIEIREKAGAKFDVFARSPLAVIPDRV